MKIQLTLVMLWLCLSSMCLAQQTAPVFHQAPNTDYILLEAEDYNLLDPPNTLSKRTWTTDTDTGSGETVLSIISGGTSYGNNPTKEVSLQAAKAQFYIRFRNPGTYYLYFRYNRQGASASGASNLLIPENPDYLPQELAILNASGDSLRWAQARMAGNNRKLQLSVLDSSRVYNVPFTPGEENLVIDKILISKESELSNVEFDKILGATSAPPDVPFNRIQYHSFEGEVAEYFIDEDNSVGISNIGVDGMVSDGRSFVQLGNSNLLLDVDDDEPSPKLVFKSIDLGCNYQDIEVCFSYFAPYLNNNVFEGGDNLTVEAEFSNGMGATSTVTLASLFASQLNLSTNHFMQICEVISVPFGQEQMQLSLTLNADQENEDLFIGEVYLKSAVAPTAPSIDVNYTNVGTAVNFDLSGSTNAGFFIYQFGDGTPPTELVTDDMPVYIYPDALVFDPCFVAFDACGNQPSLDCFILDLLSLLPVSWLDFRLNADGKDVELYWSTSSETDNSHFVVEHSRDGRNFVSIGQVEAQGAENQVTSYEFRDSNPGPGQHIYRIKQIDIDESFSYSPVRSIRLNQGGGFVSLYPNPAHDQIFIDAEGADWSTIYLTDANGRLLQRWTDQGRNRFDIGDLRPGLYLLRAEGIQGQTLWTERFLVK